MMQEEFEENKEYGDGGSLETAIRGLTGDMNMTKLAVKSAQQSMIDELRGDMGEDMRAVLNGERIVDIGTVQKKKFKIMSLFKKFLRTF
jgi:hypothetical protein